MPLLGLEAGRLASLRQRVNSLKARMALLMGLVLIAPASYAVIKAVSAYVDQSARIQTTLQRNAHTIASYDGSQLDRLRSALEKIARSQIGQDADAVACSMQLAGALPGVGDFAAIAVVQPNGKVACSSAPDLLGRSLGTQTWFRQIIGGAPFVISDVTRDGNRPDGPEIALAVPLGIAQGSVGAVVGTLPISRFNALPPTLDLPDTALVYLLDGRGQLISSRTDPILPALRDHALAALLREPGRPVLTNFEGEPRRLFVAEPVLNGRLHVVLGLSSPRWSWLERDLVIGIFAPTLMLMLAVLAIWVVTDLLINRHVRTLAIAARAYSRGRLDSPIDLSDAPTELRELGETMARMAHRVQRREAELHASLEQKNVLLKEIHHRVKNNLQIVTSLLNLRGRALVTPAARQAMIEAQLRIKALALVHRNLYEQDDVSAVQLGDFMQELCELLREASFGDEADLVELEVDAARVSISTDQAIPLALLVTEAVSNAFKHAFPDGRRGRITVRLEALGEDQLSLEVADDGIGLSAGKKRGASDDSAGMGLTLIEMLAKQLGGRLEVVEGQGTRLNVFFSVRRSSWRREPVAA